MAAWNTWCLKYVYDFFLFRYPPELLSVEKLNDLYSGLELNSTHYLGNALNMTVFGTNYAFSKLREKVGKSFTIK